MLTDWFFQKKLWLQKLNPILLICCGLQHLKLKITWRGSHENFANLLSVEWRLKHYLGINSSIARINFLWYALKKNGAVLGHASLNVGWWVIFENFLKFVLIFQVGSHSFQLIRSNLQSSISQDGLMVFWILKKGLDKSLKNAPAVCMDLLKVAWKCMKIALVI